MTNQNMVPSILSIKSIGVDITSDLNSIQTKSIAQSLYEEEQNKKEIIPSEKQQQKDNKEKK
jgi:hypothetical protein